MPLYLENRPTEFDKIIGNEETVASLQNLIKEENPPHSFLFQGDTGCGKTTISRILAKALGCRGMDLHEIDSADFRGIDTIRAIRKQIQYLPLESECQVYIIDECHKLTNDAQNAFLKALEDTPIGVYFILCTTDPQKLIPTIKGRCMQFKMKRLNETEMIKLMLPIVRSKEKSFPKAVYEQIIEAGQGLPRNTLQILEKVLQAEPEKALEVAKQEEEVLLQSIELCRALIKNAPWAQIATILSGLQDQDPEEIRRHVLRYCNSILLKEKNNWIGRIMEEFVEPFWNGGHPQLTFACYSVIEGEN